MPAPAVVFASDASEISGRPRVNSPKIVSIGSGVSDTPTGGTSADSNRRGSSASTLSRLDNIEDWRSAAFRKSEEHTSELQSLMRNSHAAFCLQKKNN